MSRLWDELLSERDQAIYRAAGLGQRAGGGVRPALLVVDVTHEFVGDRPEPVLESIKRYPNSCGEAGWEAMRHISALLDHCRAMALPIFYTKATDDASPLTRGSWTWKAGRVLEQADPNANTIPAMIAPGPGEPVIQKTKPSAFFGTPLASYLVGLSIDTLIVTGTSTSGCVRATVVDAFSLNYRVMVVEEGVFDRGDLPHKANLFDMHAKYADVVCMSDALRYLDRVAAEQRGTVTR